MSQSSAIKAQIKTILDALVSGGTLGQVIEDDFKVNIWQRDFSTFPVAILIGPATDSSAETNRENMRTYTYQIMILQLVENIRSVSAVEDLLELVLNAFDNAPGLAGAAVGGLFPSSSVPEPVVAGGRSMVIFSVILKAKTLYQITIP